MATLLFGETRTLQRDWRIFTALTFLFSFGFSLYLGVFQNFLRDVHHVGPLGLGQMESLREIPGLLAALTAGTLAALAESRVAGLGLFITAVGIGATGAMPNYSTLLFATIFWSVGFHLWATVQGAITLALAKGEEGGRHLGRMGAVASVATLAALGAAWLVRQIAPGLPYAAYFYVAGTCIAGSALLCSLLGTHASGSEPRARLILRREYGLFYLLTFLEGCRRQIFSIFASFALILVYHVPLAHMLALQFVNAILIAVTAPQIGKIVDKRGQRGPLTFYSVGLIVVFLGYAVVQNKVALYALFLLDNVLFSFGVGFTTYLHRIVRKGELTPCLAMGTTMNHVAAVTVPVAGAWLWQKTNNYQLPFWVGVFVAVIALVANRWLPHGPAPKRKMDEAARLPDGMERPVREDAAAPAATSV